MTAEPNRTAFDTNVLASGFVRPQSIPGELLRRWSDEEFVLVVSETILTELERTLRSPYFSEFLSSAQVNANIELLRRESYVAEVTSVVKGVATHHEDDLVLALAESVSAPYLVTGDRQLLRLGMHKETRIVSPRDFLALLDARDDEDEELDG